MPYPGAALHVHDLEKPCRREQQKYPGEWGVCCPSRKPKGISTKKGAPNSKQSETRGEPGIKIVEWLDRACTCPHADTCPHQAPSPVLPPFRVCGKKFLESLRSNSQTSHYAISFSKHGCLSELLPKKRFPNFLSLQKNGMILLFPKIFEWKVRKCFLGTYHRYRQNQVPIWFTQSCLDFSIFPKKGFQTTKGHGSTMSFSQNLIQISAKEQD